MCGCLSILSVFLCAVVGEEFIKYMVAFKPILIEGLKNHAEHQVSLFILFKYNQYPEIINLNKLQ